MTEAPRISLARLPTALEPLDRISEAVSGPRIWLKRDDTTDTTACGNKLRKLEFSVGQALAEGATTLITCGGAQSNHCRATAVVAAKLGLKCQLLLRGRPGNDGNLLLDQMFGAGIHYIDAAAWAELPQQLEQAANAARQSGEVPFVIPTGASDEIGMWGYIEAAAELKQDFAVLELEPAAIVSATGSGGTLGGLIVGRERYGLSSEIVSFNVCDDEQYFIDKINGDVDRWRTRYNQQTPDPIVNVIDGYVGPGYGRADEPVFETIRMAARLEGVVFDPVYTGKAFAALIEEIKKGRFDGASDLVFIHTGGIFGVFPHRDQLVHVN